MLAENPTERTAGGEPDGAAARADSGLLCLVMLLRVHHIAQTPDQVAHQLGLADKPATKDDIVRYLKRNALRAQAKAVRAEKLWDVPLPAIAPMLSGEFMLLLRVGTEGAVCFDTATRRNVVLELVRFLELWSGELIFASRRARFMAGDLGRFDIGWFIPAVLKFRTALAEVFVASFFIQTLGLVSPIFFQVIVDKVLTHRSMSTLDVLLIGLAVNSVFEVVLGGIRSYLFSHTTNRIDVMLGAKLFHHMQSLPLAYFQSRRVGETVARMRELENIRRFLTESSLTLVLDMLFGFVFLAVMFYYSVKLSLLVVASFPLFIALSLVVTPILRARVREQARRGAENQSFLVETVSAIETVKAMAVEPQMQRRWEDQLAAYVGASFSTFSLGNVASQVAQLINKAVVVGTL
jgi:subfamily B ATP-binding cassette protein HlyB/CyaB